MYPCPDDVATHLAKLEPLPPRPIVVYGVVIDWLPVMRYYTADEQVIFGGFENPVSGKMEYFGNS